MNHTDNTPLKGESSKVTTNQWIWCPECDTPALSQMEIEIHRDLRHRPNPLIGKPPQSNLILDVIWAWLIKQGVEVSEEAKDELAKQVKQVIGG